MTLDVMGYTVYVNFILYSEGFSVCLKWKTSTEPTRLNTSLNKKCPNTLMALSGIESEQMIIQLLSSGLFIEYN